MAVLARQQVERLVIELPGRFLLGDTRAGITQAAEQEVLSLRKARDQAAVWLRQGLVGTLRQLVAVGAQVSGGIVAAKAGARQVAQVDQCAALQLCLLIAGTVAADYGGLAELAQLRAVGSAEWRPCDGPMPTVEKRLTNCTLR